MLVILAKTSRDLVKYENAIDSEDIEEWLEAVEENLDLMRENKVWEIANRPSLDEEVRKIKKTINFK